MNVDWQVKTIFRTKGLSFKIIYAMYYIDILIDNISVRNRLVCKPYVECTDDEENIPLLFINLKKESPFHMDPNEYIGSTVELVERYLEYPDLNKVLRTEIITRPAWEFYDGTLMYEIDCKEV